MLCKPIVRLAILSAAIVSPLLNLLFVAAAGDDTSNYFVIASANGQIARSSNAGLNYEALQPAGAYYNVTVTVSDGTTR